MWSYVSFPCAPLACLVARHLMCAQGAPVFPGSSRLGFEPKTPGWLVQDPTTRPIGNLITTIGGSGLFSVINGFCL